MLLTLLNQAENYNAMRSFQRKRREGFRLRSPSLHPDQEWMEQIARSATQKTWGHLHPRRYVLHDRDTKFCASFRSTLADGGGKPFGFRREVRI